MISAKNQNGTYVEPYSIYTKDGKEIISAYDKNGRKIYGSISSIQGVPPFSFTSDGTNLYNYKIYGNTIENQGVGKLDSATNQYYIHLRNNGLIINLTRVAGYGYLNDNGAIVSNDNYQTYDYVSVNSSKVFLTFLAAVFSGTRSVIISFYDDNHNHISQFVDTFTNPSSSERVLKEYEVDVPSTATLLRLSVCKYGSSIHSSDTNVELYELSTFDVYVGGNQLQADEYVDYRKQKIYKMVSGVLTPTTPDTPIPQIETFSGENTLSAISEVHPSNVFIKGNVSEIS